MNVTLPALFVALGLVAAVPPAPEAAPPRTSSAWLPYWDQETGYRDALAHAEQLHTVSPFWYQAKAADRVDPHYSAEDTRIVDGLHKAGIKVVPTVMETLPAGALAAILTDPGRRATHLRTLLAVAERGDYDGLELDYETIAPTPEPAYRKVRAGYAALVTDLCAALHKRGKTCAVAVTPQTDGSGRIWDYPALGRAADRVRIMAYNLHWEGGEAGPLATPAWYDRILAHATSVIPRAKIETALPAYGWDWTPGGPTKHVTWKEAEALRKRTGAPYRLDPDAGSPHFTYEENGRERTVWYQDARGVAAHLPVLRKHGITQTGLWALGFEDPGVWKVLAGG
ncbi:glycoside hydrolase [Streptomyces spiroverticillatus]|uniref:Glycoside hydrolase n=1 Tax=Streptomyces finlayi TaxID=67296 RepID=A0A918X3E4_9ACTN|nr:glycosyl hydrolase family 18 protein [Streptomyces finlayi]GHA26646.1 glycoside hydrolase [Streptomyces spiroverticillatus]GHD08082.1 glycoside hydrolase [Streptomyces finlayi]